MKKNFPYVFTACGKCRNIDKIVFRTVSDFLLRTCSTNVKRVLRSTMVTRLWPRTNSTVSPSQWPNSARELRVFDLKDLLQKISQSLSKLLSILQQCCKMTRVQGRCPAFEGLREAFSKSSLRTLIYLLGFALMTDFDNARYLLRTEIQIEQLEHFLPCFFADLRPFRIFPSLLSQLLGSFAIVASSSISAIPLQFSTYRACRHSDNRCDFFIRTSGLC